MMSHEERARFVRDQLRNARVWTDGSGTGATVAQAIIECWERDLNDLAAEEWHGMDSTAPKAVTIGRATVT